MGEGGQLGPWRTEASRRRGEGGGRPCAEPGEGGMGLGRWGGYKDTCIYILSDLVQRVDLVAYEFGACSRKLALWLRVTSSSENEVREKTIHPLTPQQELGVGYFNNV